MYNDGMSIILYKIDSMIQNFASYTAVIINHGNNFNVAYTYSDDFLNLNIELNPITPEQFNTIYNKAKAYLDYIEEYTNTRGEKLRSIIKSWE